LEVAKLFEIDGVKILKIFLKDRINEEIVVSKKYKRFGIIMDKKI
jgi:hypothetical protein